MSKQEHKLPDGRSMSQMTAAEAEEHEHARAVVQENASLAEEELDKIHGGLTFRETKWDRFRLWNYAFWNGELDVMSDLMQGKPLSEISWRP
ncbi:MAG: hypothetical protein OXU50_04405 [Gammaproteobacteria bacterium]|nr:hypothetical protein [Gammaproteobacteria bacterium]MDD9869118.1 hypothetical protein [Gammaproteobacteria bacterium]MDD9885980.1 hypothetical protein [Gammaproteobacteria bacterium]